MNAKRCLQFPVFLMLLLAVIFPYSAHDVTLADAAGAVLYVVPGGLATGSCAGWATACNLQYALSMASSGSALWVKKGIYHPTQSTDRTISFSLKNGLALYGGFAGTETQLSQRNPTVNVTILSGDIGVPGDKSDNSYHVVVGINTDQTTILDGFVVQAGNANGTYPADVGAGVFNSGGGATFTNVTFLGNSATNGGGMFNRGSSPTFTNVTFLGNTATNGGGMFNWSNSPILTNVTFRDNWAGMYGGGMYNHPTSSATLTDVTFQGNWAMEGGGMNGSADLTNVTFRDNSARFSGGGLLLGAGALTNVTFSGNVAEYGGGLYAIWSDNATLTNVTFRGNEARSVGGGMGSEYSSPTLTNVLFVDNSAGAGGGMWNFKSNPTLTDVTFSGNLAEYGGGMHSFRSYATLTDVIFSGNSADIGGGINIAIGGHVLTNVTFSGNRAAHSGGGMVGKAEMTNVTFSNNSAAEYGGGMVSGTDGDVLFLSSVLTNVTFHGNTAPSGGALYNWEDSHPVIRNSILYGDSGGEIVSAPSGSVTVSYSDVQGGYPGDGNISADPLLGPLADNGGFTPTMALGVGSPAIDTAEDATCPPQDQRGLARPQGTACDMGAYEAGGNIHVMIGGMDMGFSLVEPMESTRRSYTGVNAGPVEITQTKGMPLIAAERVIYKVNNVATSFTEMMGLPDSQLDTTYWLPWYNNVDLDTQLRIANVSNSTATVHVSIGGNEMQDSPLTLAAGESNRISFTGINDGPVQIVSDQVIVAAERVIYKAAGVNTSFSEMMALPAKQLDTTYWLPWYNNRDLDTQLRIANISTNSATVHVFIGNTEMTPAGGITFLAGESQRLSYAGVNNGPVQIVSDQNIVAAARVIYKTAGGFNTSFTEMMALPNSQLDLTYWLPWYNNVDLDTQLRVGNVSGSPATVNVYVGGQLKTPTPITLAPGASTRLSFAGVNSGLVKIVSNVPIVASERVIYKVNGVSTSFSEMMGLPDQLLNTKYWFPWYNNRDLDTQLRFGVP